MSRNLGLSILHKLFDFPESQSHALQKTVERSYLFERLWGGSGGSVSGYKEQL